MKYKRRVILAMTFAMTAPSALFAATVDPRLELSNLFVFASVLQTLSESADFSTSDSSDIGDRTADAMISDGYCNEALSEGNCYKATAHQSESGLSRATAEGNFSEGLPTPEAREIRTVEARTVLSYDVTNNTGSAVDLDFGAVISGMSVSVYTTVGYGPSAGDPFLRENRETAGAKFEWSLKVDGREVLNYQYGLWGYQDSYFETTGSNLIASTSEPWFCDSFFCQGRMDTIADFGVSYDMFGVADGQTVSFIISQKATVVAMTGSEALTRAKINDPNGIGAPSVSIAGPPLSAVPIPASLGMLMIAIGSMAVAGGRRPRRAV